jgi:hypothetical protein
MDHPSAEQLRGFLSWVPFLEPLSEDERGWLAERLSCTGLEAGEVSVLGPDEHAEQMALLLVGQLQVYETDPSGRELTLAVLEGGSSSGRRAWFPADRESCACAPWSRRSSATRTGATSSGWRAPTRSWASS